MKEDPHFLAQMMTGLAMELLEEDKSPEYIIQFLIDNLPPYLSDSEKHSIAIQALRGAAQQ